MANSTPIAHKLEINANKYPKQIRSGILGILSIFLRYGKIHFSIRNAPITMASGSMVAMHTEGISQPKINMSILSVCVSKTVDI